MSDESEELNASQLGTKSFWDETYARELSTFENTKDVGEVWFGMDSVQRVVDWMMECPGIHKSSAILDLGCGNGIMLTELADSGYEKLFGVDYCHDAIKLAKKVAEEEGKTNICYQTCDILMDLTESSSDDLLGQQYDVILDKGTYDAISLNPESPQLHRNKYMTNIRKLMSPGGLFILTSCNWSETELRLHFSNGFKFIEKIPSPTFQFGGKSGNRETVLILQLNPSSSNNDKQNNKSN